MSLLLLYALVLPCLKYAANGTQSQFEIGAGDMLWGLFEGGVRVWTLTFTCRLLAENAHSGIIQAEPNQGNWLQVQNGKAQEARKETQKIKGSSDPAADSAPGTNQHYG